MRSQQIFIEIDGKQIYVGDIRGNTAADAVALAERILKNGGYVNL